NKELIEANNKRGILTEAWSPLGRGYLNDVLVNGTIEAIAKKYDRSPAQVILNWNNQNHDMTNVKAGNYNHQLEDLDLLSFELSKDDLAQIDALDKGEPGRVEGQHPNEY